MSKYLLIHKEILPDYFEKVIKVQEMVNQNCSVSDACKTVNLSRSTYYKYKDYVKRPTINYGKKIVLSLKLIDHKGVLSNIINYVANNKGNIISINQEVPIHSIAFVTMTIDTFEMNLKPFELIKELQKNTEVIDATVLAVE